MSAGTPDIYEQNDKVEISVMGTVLGGHGGFMGARIELITIEIPREKLADYEIVDGIASLTPEAYERNRRSFLASLGGGE